MKKLLITTAIVAFAGAAAAEVTWSGEATLGYRSHDDNGVNNYDGSNGMYMSGDLDAMGSAELDNGITASIAYGLDVDYVTETSNYAAATAGGNTFGPKKGSGSVTLDKFPTITLESSVGTLKVGDVDHAAHELFKDTGADFNVIYEDTAAKTFTAQKFTTVGFTENEDEMVGRGDTTLSTFTVGMSYTVADGSGVGPDGMAVASEWKKIGLPVNSYTLGANGSLAGFEMSLGYEYNDADESSVVGVSTGYSWNGITGRIMYMVKSDDDADMAMAGAQKTDVSEIGLSAAYEMSNGIQLGGGFSTVSGDVNGVTLEDASAFYVSAGFKAMGADITASYEMTSLDIQKSFGATAKDDDYTTGGVVIDGSYAIEGTGVTILAGYDWAEAVALKDADNAGEFGGYYVGTTYDLGGGSKKKTERRRQKTVKKTAK